MLKGLHLKRTHLFIIAIVLLLIIVAATYFIFFQKSEVEHPDFIGANLSEADSLISTMTLDEKISRLLMIKPKDDKLLRLLEDGNLPQPGGMILSSFHSMSPVDFFKSDSSHSLRPLRFAMEYENKAFHWHNDSCRNFFVHKNQLLLLPDTGLLSKAMAYEVMENKKYGIDVWMSPEIQQFTLQEKIYHFLRKENILLAAPVMYEKYCEGPDDSLNNYFPDILLLDKDSLKLLSEGKPQWLSKCIREKLNFRGIIISQLPDEKLAHALRYSGSDLFYTDNFFSVSEKIKTLVKEKKLAERHIDKRLRKIISVLLWRDKQRAGETTASDSLQKQLGQDRIRVVDQVRRNSSLLWSNPGNLLPIDRPEAELMLFYPGQKNSVFLNQLGEFAEIKELNFNTLELKDAGKLNLIVLTSGSLEMNGGAALLSRLDSITKNKKLIVVLFSESLSTGFIPENYSMLQVTGSSPDDYSYAAQALFGAQGVRGRLPEKLAAGKYQPVVFGKNKLGQARPEVMKLDTVRLAVIDSLANDAISKGAFPGCQVFVAYRGDVVFNKSYGHHTYARKQKVKNTDVYDLASVTKVAATTLAAMKLVDRGKLDLDEELGEYFKDTHIEYTRIKPDTVIRIDTISLKELDELEREIRKCDTIEVDDSTVVFTDTMLYKATPKKNIFKCKMRDLLIHKSGLPPSLPILRFLLYRSDTVLKLPMTFILDKDSLITLDTLKNRKDTLRYLWLKYYNRKALKDTSDRQIARGMYLRREYCDTLWMDIKQSRIYSRDVYMYSDLNAVLAQVTIDSITGKPLNHYVYHNFYKPMGLRNMGYQPRKWLNRNRIVPTENDKSWRKQVLRGDVHDPSAALMGGVAGNAGLFSNAQDLGTLFQMFLQDGKYGRRQYLSPAVVSMFTRQQKRSHRGLGFDRVNNRNIAADSAPAASYGHTGFTGTCVWVDPENEIVFVFLSNRVYPKANNWKINRLHVREKIHQAFYDALMNQPENNIRKVKID